MHFFSVIWFYTTPTASRTPSPLAPYICECIESDFIDLCVFGSENYGVSDVWRGIGAARMHHGVMGKDHVPGFTSYKYRTFGQIDMGHVGIQYLMPVFLEIVLKKVM